MKKILILALGMLAAAAILSIYLFWNIGNHEYPSSCELDFVFIEQPDQITCGPTSATMLLKSYGIDASLEDVKNKTKTEWFKYDGNSIGMTSPEYIPIALKSYGLSARKTRGSLRKVKSLVSQGKPVIVLLRSGLKTWHYVAVIGYDRMPTPDPDEYIELVVVADPGYGARRQMTAEVFMGSWDFSTNMKGKSMEQKCGVCKGTGKWTESNFGPLSSCEMCSGTGVGTDVLVELLRAAEVYPQTMIVPSRSIHTVASK